MFQLSQISETLTDLLGNQNPIENAPVQEIIEQLSNAGIDISSLEGLSADQVMELINNSGIDLSNFSPDQITETLQNLNVQDFNMQEVIENVGIDNIAETIFKR